MFKVGILNKSKFNMKKRTAFIAALLSGTGLFFIAPKAISGPTIYYSFRNVGIVSNQRCINAAYSVMASNGLRPPSDSVTDGNAKFALGQNYKNSVIIDCTHSNETGQVMVIASSFKRIKYKYVKNMVNEVYYLLNY